MPPKRKAAATKADDDAAADPKATEAPPEEPKGRASKKKKTEGDDEPAAQTKKAAPKTKPAVKAVKATATAAPAPAPAADVKKGKGKAKAKSEAAQPAREESQIATLVGEDALEDGEGEDGDEAGPGLLPVTMPTSYDYPQAEGSLLKIVSYNLDGFKSACDNKMGAYCAAENADVVCFQETKMNTTPIFMNMVYPHQYWSFSSAKKGYAGTAILSKVKPLSVTYGLGKKDHDEEGRTIIAEFDDFYLVNTYVPNSGQKLERLPYRATWDTDLQILLKDLDKKKPVVWTGDLNVAHTEIDLTNPKQNKR